MKKVIWKQFWLWNFDKEEKWLNEMSALGLQLCCIGFCRYVFEQGTPGEFTYRLEMLKDLPSHPRSEKYIRFVEDTGAEYIGSMFRWAYFRKVPGMGEFDLYSDIGSRIKHLNEMLVLTGIIGGVNLINGLNRLHAWWLDRVASDLILVALCLLVGGLGTYGFTRLFLMRRRLKKEQRLHE